MSFEYEFEKIEVSDEILHALGTGMIDINQTCPAIAEVINRRGAEGWRALYPFLMFPVIWFEREKTDPDV